MDEIKKLLEHYQPLIDKSLEKVLPHKLTKDFLDKSLGQTKYELDIEALQKGIADPFWDLLDRGGKRWRPILFLLIVDLLDKDPDEFIDLSTIFEFIHNATLIIDDIEDSSEVRRGKKAVHLIYGEDITINAGNTLYYLPLKILENYQNKLSAETFLKIYQTYTQEMINLSFGQATDIVWHKGLVDDSKITVNQYLQMCAFKTGGLSRMAAKIAAIVGGADPKLVTSFGNLGESLGVVFQIQDDILNITDNELSKGKGLGEDITEGKRSLPVIYALSILEENRKDRLQEILKMHTTDQNLRDEAIALINEANAIEKSQQKMTDLFKEALDNLDPYLKESSKKQRLYNLADFLINRQV